MAYFVTGATGFIGRFLVPKLLARGKPVYVLVRKGSQKKLAALIKEWGADEKRVIAIAGAVVGGLVFLAIVRGLVRRGRSS